MSDANTFPICSHPDHQQTDENVSERGGFYRAAGDTVAPQDMRGWAYAVSGQELNMKDDQTAPATTRWLARNVARLALQRAAVHVTSTDEMAALVDIAARALRIAKEA